MKTIQINAHLRDETGKKNSKKLRKDGNVPCVMYGGEEVIHFYSHENNFKDLIYSPDVYIVKFDVDGKKIDGALKEIQFHPVTDRITHIDFIQVFDDRPVIMDIPIVATGDSIGLKAGGKLRRKRRVLRIKGLIKDLPDKLEIDISDLAIGQSIKVHELSYDNLEILDPQRAMVVAVISSRMALKDLDEAAEEEEDEEGLEEGEAAEGADEKTAEADTDKSSAEE